MKRLLFRVGRVALGLTALSMLVGVSCRPDECAQTTCETDDVALHCHRPVPEAERRAYREGCAPDATCTDDDSGVYCRDDEGRACSTSTSPRCENEDVLVRCHRTGVDRGVIERISCAYQGRTCVDVDGTARCQ